MKLSRNHSCAVCLAPFFSSASAVILFFLMLLTFHGNIFMLYAQDDLASVDFSDGSSFRFPAPWLVQIHDVNSNTLVLDSDAQLYYVQVYTPDIQQQYGIQTLADAMIDTYIPLQGAATIDAAEVQRSEVFRTPIMYWRYARPSQGVVIATRLPRGNIVVIDVFNAPLNSRGEALAVGMLLDYAGVAAGADGVLRLAMNATNLALFSLERGTDTPIINLPDITPPPRTPHATQTPASNTDSSPLSTVAPTEIPATAVSATAVAATAVTPTSVPASADLFVGSGCVAPVQFTIPTDADAYVENDQIFIDHPDYYMDLDFFPIAPRQRLRDFVSTLLTDNDITFDTPLVPIRTGGTIGVQAELPDFDATVFVYLLSPETAFFLFAGDDFEQGLEIVVSSITAPDDFGADYEECLE